MTSHTQVGRNEFPTTSWTLVVAAGDSQHRDCRAALARLCEHYWYPVYAYVRRRGYPEGQTAVVRKRFLRKALLRAEFAYPFSQNHLQVLHF